MLKNISEDKILYRKILRKMAPINSSNPDGNIGLHAILSQQQQQQPQQLLRPRQPLRQQPLRQQFQPRQQQQQPQTRQQQPPPPQYSQIQPRINLRFANNTSYQQNYPYGSVIVPNVQMSNNCVPSSSSATPSVPMSATPRFPNPPPVPVGKLETTPFTFKSIPFYRSAHVVIPTTKLTITGQNSLPPNHPKLNSAECSVLFALSLDATNAICENRNISGDTREYRYLCLLRFGVVDASKANVEELMPLGLIVRVNGRQCALPPNCGIVKAGMDVRKQPRPIDVSDQLKLCPIVPNVLTINFTPENDKKFFFAVSVVEKLSSNYLLDQLLKNAMVDADSTRQLVISRIKLYEGNEDVVGSDRLLVSLNCPLGTRRIVYPVKGKSCEHLAFFDGLSYISLNEKKPNWLCPICKQPAPYQDLLCFHYVMDILQSKKLPSDCQTVELLSDGSWRTGNNDGDGDQIDLDRSEDENDDDDITDPTPSTKNNISCKKLGIPNHSANSMSSSSTVAPADSVTNNFIDLTNDAVNDMVLEPQQPYIDSTTNKVSLSPSAIDDKSTIVTTTTTVDPLA